MAEPPEEQALRVGLERPAAGSVHAIVDVTGCFE
jgi:hypothetical protein